MLSPPSRLRRVSVTCHQPNRATPNHEISRTPLRDAVRPKLSAAGRTYPKLAAKWIFSGALRLRAFVVYFPFPASEPNRTRSDQIEVIRGKNKPSLSPHLSLRTLS